MDAGGRDEIDLLYDQVVDLGDRARGWFDGPGKLWRASLPVDAQAAIAVESLGTTARLLAVMAWLLDPAQISGDAQGQPRPAFCLDVDPVELPPRSPLAGTPGEAIAVGARRLVMVVVGIARRPALDGDRAGAHQAPAEAGTV